MPVCGSLYEFRVLSRGDYSFTNPRRSPCTANSDSLRRQNCAQPSLMDINFPPPPVYKHHQYLGNACSTETSTANSINSNEASDGVAVYTEPCLAPNIPHFSSKHRSRLKNSMSAVAVNRVSSACTAHKPPVPKPRSLREALYEGAIGNWRVDELASLPSRCVVKYSQHTPISPSILLF